MTITITTVIYALLGGMLPALGWLWFFNHEDPHPEPRTKLAKAFVAGMLVVIIAMALEQVMLEFSGGELTNKVLLGWAVIEEVLKYGAAWLVALHTGVFDEPIDALIYMLTVALGFAALENSLFLLLPISEAAYFNSVLSGGLRFIGATLVHVVASGFLGALIAASYYKSKRIRHEAVIIGLIGATLLHWGFNLLIIDTAQATILRVFALVWVAVILLMLAFEAVKHMQRKESAPYPFT